MIDLGDVAFLVGVSGWIAIWGYRTHLGHIRKVMEMRAMRGEPLDDHKAEIERLRQEVNALRGGASSGGDLAALRQEIVRLRDTSTQYDVSLDHTLQELQHRVATLEIRLRQAGQSTTPDEVTTNSTR
jgi:hypothetical protein